MRRVRHTQVATAVMVYVILLLGLQLFLLAVAAEAFLASEPGLVGSQASSRCSRISSAASLNAVLAAGTVGFYLYFRRA